jgi:uncharacterized protein (TIGR03067 family)
MSILSPVLLALFLPAAAPADPPPDTKTELAKWQGTWEVELQLTDGVEKPAKDRNVAKVVVKDDSWEVYFKGTAEPVKGKMKLVLDGNPKGLDVTVDKVVFRSIYLLDGDRIVVRVGDANEQRPKDFSTSAGSKTGAIMIYKRVKK